MCRLMGEPAALQIALTLVSKQIRENPPKERPGGPPQTLSILTRALPPTSKYFLLCSIDIILMPVVSLFEEEF